MPVAYIAQGGLHLSQNGGEWRRLESAFGRSLRDRANQIHQRHAWKSQGRGAQFMSGMLWPAGSNDPGEFPIHITGVCRGPAAGELLYSLETSDVAGVFVIDKDGVERRLFHTADFRLRHLALSPDGASIAATVAHKTVITNIAVLSAQGSDFQEMTEGDSMDLAPRWVPGGPRRVVFQSSGVGRNAAGHVTGISPSCIQELNLDSGDLELIAEEAGHDLMAPQKTSDGTLYYIRKPYLGAATRVSPFTALKDAVLFPFRISFAIFQYFNFFSMRYTGKPLVTPKGAAARNRDPQQMAMMGNLLDASQLTQDSEGNLPALVPDTWQLTRRSPSGETSTVAKGVISFDVAADGTTIYSTGTGVFQIASGERPKRLASGSLIEQVTFL